MAMGQRKDRQGDLMVSGSEMPRSPGHVFYDRLQSVPVEADFDAFAEATCKPYYAARMGAPSVPPYGMYHSSALDDEELAVGGAPVHDGNCGCDALRATVVGSRGEPSGESRIK